MHTTVSIYCFIYVFFYVNLEFGFKLKLDEGVVYFCGQNFIVYFYFLFYCKTKMTPMTFFLYLYVIFFFFNYRFSLFLFHQIPDQASTKNKIINAVNLMSHELHFSLFNGHIIVR